MKKLNINVSVKPVYLDEHSIPENDFYIWSYEITITNNSDEIVQLLNRHWRITDIEGKVEEVEGPGVIGLQPIIKPKRSFSYASFCQLNSPKGSMAGYYEMQNLEEERFKVEIPEFMLTSPTIEKERLH